MKNSQSNGVENTLTLFGFHTDDKLYRKHAQILAKSGQKFDINIHLEQVSHQKWQTIIAFKPVFIAKMRRELVGKILFVDADAVILKDIRPYFADITQDLAVHYFHDGRLISSTIFINNTLAAHLLMDEWEKRMLCQPERWDQVVLQELVEEWVKDNRITVKKLPPDFTYIFDRSKTHYGNTVQPSIEQLQASRDMRWLSKYYSRNFIHQWLIRHTKLNKSTRKILRRHSAINTRTAQLGIDVQLGLQDLF